MSERDELEKVISILKTLPDYLKKNKIKSESVYINDREKLLIKKDITDYLNANNIQYRIVDGYPAIREISSYITSISNYMSEHLYGSILDLYDRDEINDPDTLELWDEEAESSGREDKLDQLGEDYLW